MRKIVYAIITVFLFAGLLAGQDKYHHPFKFEFKKIAEDIYLAYRPDPLKVLVECNSTIIINDKDVIVFDATGSPGGARQVVEKIRELTDKPVRYLINSHGHGDHTFGNQVFVEAFPECEIIAREETRDYMSAPRGSTGANRKIAYVYEYWTEEGMKKKRDYIEGEIQRVKDEAKQGYEKVLENLYEYSDKDLELRRKEYLQVRVTPPTLILENKMSLYRGGREIQVLYLGKGDTPGDVWLYLPEEKILCTPDAVVNPIPYGFSRNHIEWLETLKKVKKMDFDILIPGHGEVQYDKKYLSMVIELLESIQRQVKEAVAKGMTLEETQEFVKVDELHNKFVKGDPVKEYYFVGYSKEPAVENTYEQLTESK
jgi:glyoxylase-like metal-dependent hydrolase (beta-lactamase superfamily II)